MHTAQSFQPGSAGDASASPRSGGAGPAVQLTTIAEIGANIAGATTIEEILRVVTSGARWLLNYQRCTLAVLTTDRTSLRLYGPTGNDLDSWDALSQEFNQGCIGQVVNHHQTLRIAELGNAAAYDLAAGILMPGARAMLMLPLEADGVVFGALSFSTSRPNAYPAETLGIGRLLALQVAGAVRNALLLEELDGRENVILSLALAIEAKDPYTEGHCQRLAQYAERIGRGLGFSTSHLTNLRMAAMLHDVGKIAVPEAILGKPGALTAEEYDILKQHPVVGENICQPLRSLRPMLPAIRHHHERWDGRGYPDGLTSDAIPLDARIIAIVDAFDAMTSDRPYRPGLPVGRALAILRENAGPQWDPELLDLFIPMIEADFLIETSVELVAAMR